MPQTIYTIGHSTRTIDEFVDLLAANQIRRLADVRRIPRSARHPHFNDEAMSGRLTSEGIAYAHFPDLGGRRQPKRDSQNTAWREAGFRGYADYMETERFSAAVSELLQYAEGERTAVMCAEAVWWRCHRRLLADALIVRGLAVEHILSPRLTKPHQMSEFAREADGKLSYPGLV